MDTGVGQRLEDLLAARAEVDAAYLFGSSLTSDDPRDVDVAVLLREGSGLRDESALQAHLEAALDRPVDLHALDRLPVDIQVRVVSTGRLLVDEDPGRRIALEVRARSMAEDLRPLLDIIRAGTVERLAGRG